MAAIVLAAGQGTRMQSADTHKVCFPVAGVPAINRMVATLRSEGFGTVVIVVGALATLFSLFMSNVAATVLLVPLAIAVAGIAGVHARPLALLVAICASNSFILPTHQVNALLMGPGGYRNADYLKVGGLMTLLFLFVAVCITYLWYA